MLLRESATSGSDTSAAALPMASAYSSFRRSLSAASAAAASASALAAAFCSLTVFSTGSFGWPFRIMTRISCSPWMYAPTLPFSSRKNPSLIICWMSLRTCSRGSPILLASIGSGVLPFWLISTSYLSHLATFFLVFWIRYIPTRVRISGNAIPCSPSTNEMLNSRKPSITFSPPTISNIHPQIILVRPLRLFLIFFSSFALSLAFISSPQCYQSYFSIIITNIR